MYSISWNDEVMGKAEVRPEGLYYRFICTCELPGDGIYRISVSDGDDTKDLGICVPDGKKFALNTRIAKKYITGENLHFSLVSQDKEKTVVTIADSAPFQYLTDLENARLEVTDGRANIIIDQAQDQPDSGQNP